MFCLGEGTESPPPPSRRTKTKPSAFVPPAHAQSPEDALDKVKRSPFKLFSTDDQEEPRIIPSPTDSRGSPVSKLRQKEREAAAASAQQAKTMRQKQEWPVSAKSPEAPNSPRVSLLEKLGNGVRKISMDGSNHSRSGNGMDGSNHKPLSMDGSSHSTLSMDGSNHGAAGRMIRRLVGAVSLSGDATDQVTLPQGKANAPRDEPRETTARGHLFRRFGGRSG